MQTSRRKAGFLRSGRMLIFRGAARMSQKLSRYYEPTFEQAVVVPEFNKGLVAMGDKN
jgi:hypothetical protein